MSSNGTRLPAEVDAAPGEKRQTRYEIGETYLGDPVAIPVTVMNGAAPGPTICLTAAIHGDELNGVKVIQEVVDQYDPADIHGRMVCLHVCNVPAYEAQQRYTPIYDQDMNRSFPGSSRGQPTSRMANTIYNGFIRHADMCLDFHTSTRHRTTIYHVRADLQDSAVNRLTRAFGTSVVLDGEGEAGTLRTVATADGTPTITVEMGRGHCFQPDLIEKASEGVESVLAEYGMLPDHPVHWPGWYTTTDADTTKRWLRADIGGLVEMHWGPYPLVRSGDTICRITNHFGTEEQLIEAPFDGLIVGSLENPVVAPGHPVCHLLRLDAANLDEIQREIARGEFDGYQISPAVWHADTPDASES